MLNNTALSGASGSCVALERPWGDTPCTRVKKKPKQDGSVQFSSVVQSCPTLCNPMNRSTPGLPVHHQLPEFTQTHVHRVGDAIQPSHPLSSPSPPAPNPSQHQGLFQWVNVLHEVAKVLEFQLQHQSFQWTQDGRRGKFTFKIKPHSYQRRSEGSNKPSAHQDPGSPQRLRENCVWVSPVEVWVSSGLPQGQGLWVQQTWVWHKRSWRRSQLTQHRAARTYTGWEIDPWKA